MSHSTTRIFSLLHTLSDGAGLVLLIALTVLYAYKGPSLSSIKSTIRRRMNKHDYIPLDFNSQLEAGISSNTFNLDENITEDEARQGLDARGVEEIDRMMRREGLTFDQARLKRHNKILADNGISSDGKPKDPKFVSFD